MGGKTQQLSDDNQVSKVDYSADFKVQVIGICF